MSVPGKLSRKEIDSALTKIRKKYEEYISFYNKSIKIKDHFEARYKQTVLKNMDMTLFIMDEMKHITTLIKKEEDSINNPSQIQFSSRIPKKKSFGDQVLEQLQQKMLRYPGLGLPGDAIPDIKHLYGALYLLDQKYWFPAISVLSKKSHLWSGSNIGPLEQDLQQLSATKNRPVPKALERYINLLNQKEYDLKELSLEARRSIAQASFFLHKVDNLLDKALSEDNIKDKDVKNLSLLVKKIIADFRLKDIK